MTKTRDLSAAAKKILDYFNESKPLNTLAQVADAVMYLWENHGPASIDGMGVSSKIDGVDIATVSDIKIVLEKLFDTIN